MNCICSPQAARKWKLFLAVCWAVRLSRRILYVHRLLSLLVLKTGTDKALKVAATVKGQWKQGKVKRKIQNYHGASDMHDASIFEFITSIYRGVREDFPFQYGYDRFPFSRVQGSTEHTQWVETLLLSAASGSFSLDRKPQLCFQEMPLKALHPVEKVQTLIVPLLSITKVLVWEVTLTKRGTSMEKNVAEQTAETSRHIFLGGDCWLIAIVILDMIHTRTFRRAVSAEGQEVLNFSNPGFHSFNFMPATACGNENTLTGRSESGNTRKGKSLPKWTGQFLCWFRTLETKTNKSIMTVNGKQ